MHDTIKLRRRGITATAISLDTFESASLLQAKSMGMENTPVIVIPRNNPDEWTQEVAWTRAEKAFDDLVESLQARTVKAGKP
jgi:hypothetical protein